jgi:flagellar motor switch protein FliM
MSHPTISTEELDALMRAARTEPTAGESARPAKAVKAYDFAHPDRLSKEQLRHLEMITANGARGMAAQLSEMLRTPAEVEAGPVGEAPGDAFLEGLSADSSVAMVRLEPQAGKAMLGFDPAFGLALLDRLLGGSGTAAGEARELTEIEKGLMGRVAEGLMGCYAEAWASVLPMKPAFDGIVGAEAMNPVTLAKEALLRTEIEVRFGPVTGRLHLGVPTAALDPALSKLHSSAFAVTAAGGSEQDAGAIRSTLDRMSVELKVELGHAEVSMRDLLELQAGDLICLDRRAGSDMDLRVGTELKFRGRPGRVGRRLGFQVTHVVTEEG